MANKPGSNILLIAPSKEFPLSLNILGSQAFPRQRHANTEVCSGCIVCFPRNHDGTLSEPDRVWIRVDVSGDHSRRLRFATANRDQPFATIATAGCSTAADSPRLLRCSSLNKNSSFLRAASVEYRARDFPIPFSESRSKVLPIRRAQ